MTDSPLDNFNINIKFDADGEVSTNPADVVKLGQQMLIKALLTITDNGKNPAADVKDLNMLVTNMNNTALMTRKLDQEQESLYNQQELVEAFKHFEQLSKGQNLYGDSSKPITDPYADVDLLEVHVNPGELEQGEVAVNVDDFIQID